VPLTAHADCLLVVVDAQPGFGSDEDVLARARWLAALARALEVPVLITEEEPEHNGPTHAGFGDAPVFTKPTFGLAGTPEILDAVRATGRNTAVLVGFETDVCVYQSAVGLQDAGLRVIVAEDAVSSPGEMHARGLDRLRAAGVTLTHCKALAYEWVRTVERSSALLGSGVLGPAPFRL